MAAEASSAPAGVMVEDVGARPTERLPLLQLIQLSIYWFGIQAIWGGVGVFTQERIPQLVPQGQGGFYLALTGWITLPIVLAIQPTVGAISDYTISRWGRRKPYIVIGTILDVIFITGLATSQSYLSVVAFLALLQFSSNFAQGPFQGYVPDLVPQPQVALASALIGAMQTVGFVAGNIVIATAYRLGEFTLPMVVLGLVELATGIVTVVTVREGRAAKPRAGRSWISIARSAWGLDILRERSFVFLCFSRLLFLAGVNVLLGFYILFLTRSLGFGPDDKELWVPVITGTVAVFTAITTIPSGVLSNRFGRKPMIYVACVVGTAGLATIGAAPGIEVVLIGAILVGIGSGTFLAVDWALMTDIIPKASSGRFMGISNLAVGLAGPTAGFVAGPLIDLVGGVAETGEGPRAAFLAGSLLFAVSAVFLWPVDPRPREQRALAAPSPTAPA
ncbi:MAG TPA: MFS transporter [Candidatus Deferrimicrobiaceae bacterium]|nr:MFS transporter [Candidatus Deferrimicrobiaceae bacterium]